MENQDRDAIQWKDFLDAFRTAFGDPNPAATVRHKMSQLKQTNHTADEYVASFKELEVDTEYNDAVLVEFFQKGLNSSLVDTTDACLFGGLDFLGY
ncbi:hypothetical protein CVT25_014453 [Psilocybe cyanescens]|uniref:Retrotransposon gag domain-containing protein n=1 Tax=Psilocybe cyanescens TaxID=93625 RepID=A0A409XPA9_PSICY|nr:hypothetical protein CVT25_014453 [Psilocybe cyanescens]